MKPRAIIADPVILFRAGLRNLADMVVLIHLGRCGLVGSVRPAMVEALGIHYETLRAVIDRLEDLKWVISSSTDSGQGRACRYVVTTAGWEVLTTAADYSPYQSQMPLSLVTPKTKQPIN